MGKTSGRHGDTNGGGGLEEVQNSSTAKTDSKTVVGDDGRIQKKKNTATAKKAMAKKDEQLTSDMKGEMIHQTTTPNNTGSSFNDLSSRELSKAQVERDTRIIKYAMGSSEAPPSARTTANGVQQGQDQGDGIDFGTVPFPETQLNRTVMRPDSTPGAFTERGSGDRQRTSAFRADMLTESERTPLEPLRVAADNNPNNTGGLAVANQVSGSEHFRLPQAIQEQDITESASNPKRMSEEGRKKFWTYVILGMVAFVVVLTLSLTFSLAGDEGIGSSSASTGTKTPPAAGAAPGSANGGTSTTTDSPSEAPSISPETLVLSLLPEETGRIIQRGSASTPQYRAFHWLIEDPNFYKLTDARIIQRFVLATIYYSTRGQGWLHNDGWLNYSIHECDWHAYDATTAMDPDTWFGPAKPSFRGLVNVTHWPCNAKKEEYHHLWLYTNTLVGSLPDEISLLTTLKSLLVGNNELTGSIPTTLGLLTNLMWLDLAPNKDMISEIPTQLGRLTHLQELYLATININSTIPTQIGLLSNIKYELEISQCNLRGTIPTEIGRLSNADWFDIQNNHVSGTIPSQMGLMTGIHRLRIGRNLLTGTVPTELGMMQQMTWFTLQGNQLSGTIASELARATSSTHFYFYENNFVGTIATELGTMSHLEWFTVNHNSLTGTIPTELGKLVNVEEFGFQNNLLTGTIPTELAMGTNAKWFDFYDNELLTGPIPSEFGSLGRNCTRIDVSHTSVNGGIPSEFGLLTKLLKLGFEDTQLSGTIPKEMNHLALDGPLVMFNITDTLISGEISADMCALGAHIKDRNSECPWWHWEVRDCPSFEFSCSDRLCGCGCPCEGNMITESNANETTTSETIAKGGAL